MRFPILPDAGTTPADHSTLRYDATLNRWVPGPVVDPDSVANMNAVLQDYQAGQDATDTAVSSVVTTGPQTTAALDARYGRQKVIDANKRGVKADGTTDDQAAWQALVNSCTPGDVITWTGRSILRSGIVWKSGVSLVGQGMWGRSILATVDETGTNFFSAIQFLPNDAAATSVTNPIEDVTFANFEIDGSGINSTARHIGAKGIFGQFMRRCQFLNLYIHDTIGTGLGTDYMPDCLIHGVVTIDCGRNWLNGGGGGGQAGIGIGTGAWEDESLTISDCHAISTNPATNPAHWGIFVEWQDGQPYRGRGIRIVGCSATGAVYGFGDRGTAGTTFLGCTAYGNTTGGFKLENGSRDGMFQGCSAFDNTGSGFECDSTLAGRYAWRGNRAYGNTKSGFLFPISTSAVPHLTVEGNEAWDNGETGIRFTSSTAATAKFTDLVVRGNRVWSNGKLGSNSFTNRGIRFDGNVERFDFSHNDATDPAGTKTQQVGVTFASSFAFTDGQIAFNNVKGNATATGLEPSGTKTNVRVLGNLGYVTEADGTGVIADGAASATVTHGLATTPTVVTLGKRSSEDVWVSARSSSSFTVTRTGTAGALTFDWTAAYRP